MGPRPTGITILAALNAVAGLWNLWMGSMFLGLGIAALFTVESGAVGGYGLLYGIFLVALGVVLFIVAAGYYGLEPWAWLFGVVVNAVNLVVSVLSGVFTGERAPFLGIVLPLVILFYLFRPRVRDAFER